MGGSAFVSTRSHGSSSHKLVALYKQEAAIILLRAHLRGPELLLATEQQVDKLLNSITKKSNHLN
ncbi:hypothetical protein VP01_5238g2, partial [Puccinia sorghi]